MESNDRSALEKHRPPEPLFLEPRGRASYAILDVCLHPRNETDFYCQLLVACVMGDGVDRNHLAGREPSCPKSKRSYKLICGNPENRWYLDWESRSS